MIFVTVGSELAFDRMLSVVDAWAAENEEDVVAQTGPSELHSANIHHEQFFSPDVFKQYVADCSVMIAHAGMGSILCALQQCKPIIIMPRRVKFHETRSDHQVATAKKFKNRAGIYVAMGEAELKKQLDKIHLLKAGNIISPYASDELLAAVRSFIDGCS